MTDWMLRRRELLRHLGAGLAMLPVLRATRSYGATPAEPKRLIIVVATDGYPGGQFLPKGSGTDLSALTLSPTMAPLNPWKKDLVMFPQLAHPTFARGGGHGAYGVMFTAAPANEVGEYWTPKAPSLDQVVADGVAKYASVPLRTLPLQARVDKVTAIHGGLPPSFIRCFWRGERQPITPEGDPYKVFDNLFAGKSTADAAAERLRAERRSILDYLGRDLTAFGSHLGTEDRQSIEGHLSAVRDVEKQLAAVQPTLQNCVQTKAALTRPANFDSNDNYPALVSLHMDLMLGALRCDVTRVATLQLASAVGDEAFPRWAGVTGPALAFAGDPAVPSRSWHDCAHREVGPTGNDKVRMDTWLMGRFADLLQRLKDTALVGGSMLDQSCVLWANHMWTGGHDKELPWILAGRCGGYFKTGQFMAGAKGTPINKVMADICNAMDVPVSYFGAPQYAGTVDGLKAS